MNRRIAALGCVFAALSNPAVMHAADAPTPKTSAAFTTGEIDLTFTERSPLSERKEIARRLVVKDAELGDDYDLAKHSFKVYVPRTYGPGVSCGIFVYLGYKDSVSVATPWEPVLDTAHLIFITPVSHHGTHYPNSIPLWQTMGLAFDAVHNLKHQFNVDEKRIYLMSLTDSPLRLSLASADVFSGMIVMGESEYCERIVLPDRRFYPPRFAAPPEAIFHQAKHRAIVYAEPNSGPADQPPQLVFAAMKRAHFEHLLPVTLSYGDDLHYPNLKPQWFEQTVLPFLDSVTTTPVKMPDPHAVKPPETRPADSNPTPSKPSAVSPPAPRPVAPVPPAPTNVPAATESSPDAQRLLSLARLYIKNHQSKLAREKLEGIIRLHPNDPACPEARNLLQQLPKE